MYELSEEHSLSITNLQSSILATIQMNFPEFLAYIKIQTMEFLIGKFPFPYLITYGTKYSPRNSRLMMKNFSFSFTRTVQDRNF